MPCLLKVPLDHLPLLHARRNALLRPPGRRRPHWRDPPIDTRNAQPTANDRPRDILRQTEEGVCQIGRSRIVRVQRGNELRVRTANVHHRVDRRLRENGHLSRAYSLGHGTRAILGDHICHGRSGDGDDVVGRARVNVWWEQGARAQVEHRLCIKGVSGTVCLKRR